MKLRRLAFLIVFLQLLDISSLRLQAHAQVPEKEAYERIAAWFEHLVQSVDKIAAVVDKQRLVAYTTDLGNSFEAMVRDKREIAELLKRQPIDKEELPQLLDRLELNVKLAKTRLAAVSLQLKQQDEALKGAELAEALNSVLFERKGWIVELKARLQGGSTGGFDYLAKQAGEFAKALDQANTQLAKFINAVRNS